jgi:PAS domain S-box-containing protein
MADVDFRGLVDGLTDVIAVLDRDRRYVYANAALEAIAGTPLVGLSNDDLMGSEDGARWREVIDSVLATGEPRELECTLPTPRGARRFASIVTRLSSDRVCAITRDVTDIQTKRLLDITVREMATPIVIAEAPSGRLLFVSDEASSVFGPVPSSVANVAEYAVLAGYDKHGRRITNDEWPVARALHGETIVNEQIDIDRIDTGERRTVSISAWPVRDASGTIIAAVGRGFDVTDTKRAFDAAQCLAAASTLLDRFDPETSPRAIANLAVPALADVCFVHTPAPGREPPVLAGALARVLAGGPRELVDADDAELAAAGYRCAVVAPMHGRTGVVGAITFAMTTSSGRRYNEHDLETLSELARRTGLALDNARLFQAERGARADVERARLRERQLHIIAARLSSALTQQQIGAIACSESVAFVGARGGTLYTREGDDLVVTGHVGSISMFERVPLSTHIPSTDAIRDHGVVWCASEAELAARYPHLEEPCRARGIRSCGAIAFSFEHRPYGCIAVGFETERGLAVDDRAFLHAVGQLAAQALERARLFEAHRASEERLRLALTTARAATWSLDLATNKSIRDESYALLLGQRQAEVDADFMTIHPEDREVARESFRRALAEGVPYEPEVRIRRDDGTYMWIRAHGRVVYNSDGKPETLAGVVVDIDEAKRASMRADEERRINDELHRLTMSFAAELDHDRLLQLITDEATRLVGAEAGALFVHDRGNVVVAGNAALVDNLRSAAVASAIEVTLSTRGGEAHGTLVVGHSQAERFSEHHIRLLVGLASQATIAIDNARLYKTVREQKEQLEIAVDRARAADRRKDEFLAMLGHELRNPLAPIATALDLMDLNGNADSKERAVIRRQVGHLSRLIDDLLDVSRITRGKIQLSRAPVELASVIAKAVEMASPLLEKRMQRLTIDVPRTGLVVDADATRLAQVFQNLVMNAAKYSDVGAHVSLSARADAGHVTVEVRDEGIGISPELMPRLFDLFVQGERALDRSEGGLGIGLTVARSLCELHGGTISATSDGVGRGSTFTVTLPRLAEDHSAAPAPAPATPRVIPRGNRPRVLLVDDNVDAAQMLRDILETLGHELAIAHDGPAALEVASTFEPDIAVLDIGLPVMNGYELAQKLRERTTSGRLKLIALTGYGQDADRQRSLEVGFDHHLIKPIELDALLALLGS